MNEMTGLLAQHGLAIVFANVLLTQLGLPLPAIPTLIVAGALAYAGGLSAPLVVGVAVLASLLGDTPWFFAGRRYGYPILRTLCRIAIEPDSCVKQTERIFERWGPASLAVAKYIPGFATVAPPLAGTMRLDFPRFVMFSALGALLYAAVPVAAGALFHAEVEWALGRLERMGTGALLVIAAVIAGYAGVKAVERYLLIRFLRMVRIGVEELRELLGREPRPVILDARSALARQLDPRRIPGALPVDIDAPGRELAAIPRDRDVVVYCS
jgi:membrane protein DedA with SNARE-associated domain